jgi:FMN reductase
VVELREYAHDIVDALLDPFPDSRLAQVFERIREADAVVAVTPIFNMGPSGLFKTFVDAGDKDLWENKPLLLGATAGTSRHSLAIDFAIRPLFSYLRARVVPTAVFAASADLGAASPTEIDGDPLWQRAQRAATELLDLLEVGRTSRPTFPATPAEFDPGS